MSFGVEKFLSDRGAIDAELRKNKSPVTVMFTDLAGSTAFFEHHGDTVGMKWIEEHYRIIIPIIAQYGGVVVKTIGDSVMAYFVEPTRAAEAAIAIEQGINHGNSQRPLNDQMYVRVALHHGLAYLRGGDVFGDVVNVTARIAKACLPAQILVSEALYLAAREESAVQFLPAGEFRFHGKATTEKVYEVLWADEETHQQLRQKFPAKPKTSEEEIKEGRYIIVSELGRGAMGVVYKAYDRLIGRVVAMKTIPVEVQGPEFHMLVDRLKQEARTAGMLDHPNIVTVFDVGEEAGLFYFTMQYVEGRDLEGLRQSKELLPFDQVLAIADQVCSALAFAHQAGIIHRDIKPANLMLTPQGNVKVMDFGIAKLGDMGLTKAGMVLGTPSYLAPEQAAARRVDHRADIFSLGSVLYELFTGEKAFPGESTTSIVYKVINEEPLPPHVIEPSLPPALDGIVRKALAKDPNQRFQSCDELRQALRDLRQGRTQPVTNATLALAPALGPGERTRRFWILTALLLVPAIAATMFFAWKRPLSPPRPLPATTLPASTAQPVAQPSRPPESPGSAALVAAPTQAPVAQSPTPEAQPSAEVERAKTTSTKSLSPERKKRGRTIEAGEKERLTPEALTAAPSQAREASRASGMWTQQDVPDLLAKADAYAGRGQYPKAILLYQEVLGVDPQNRAAKEGLRRVQEAQEMRR